MIRISLLLLLLSSHLFAFDKLKEDYLVRYGDENAPLKIVQYFSFTCPHCVALYRKQFHQIKEEFINTNKITWVFHPVPMDLLTVQAMECLQLLSPRQKKIFLEAILEEVLIDNPKLSGLMLQKGIDILGKPLPNLLDESYLSDTQTFQDAFAFLKQEGMLTAVPAAEVNHELLPGQIPDIALINETLSRLGGKL